MEAGLRGVRRGVPRGARALVVAREEARAVAVPLVAAARRRALREARAAAAAAGRGRAVLLVGRLAVLLEDELLLAREVDGVGRDAAVLRAREAIAVARLGVARRQRLGRADRAGQRNRGSSWLTSSAQSS